MAYLKNKHSDKWLYSGHGIVHCGNIYNNIILAVYTVAICTVFDKLLDIVMRDKGQYTFYVNSIVNLLLYTYIYIYIYMCVCVCVCVRARARVCVCVFQENKLLV